MLFRLAHFSDPHLSSPDFPSLDVLLGKPLLGYLSWRLRRRFRHRIETMDPLLDDLGRAAPDHVVVTGDLTHAGLPQEYEQVARWLPRLGSPDRVTVVPGNHDVYGKLRWEASFLRWHPFMTDDTADGGTRHPPRFGLFPSLRLRGAVAVIGVSSARPAPPFRATGSVGATQAKALGQVLETTGSRGLFRVVLIHHSPVEGAERPRRRLVDGRRVRDVIHRFGAELVLHGHGHRTVFAELPTPSGVAPVVGARSSSSTSRSPERSAQYHLYDIAGAPGAWRVAVSMRGLPVGEREVREIDHRVVAVGAAATPSSTSA